MTNAVILTKLNRLSAESTVMFSQLVEDTELMKLVVAGEPYEVLFDFVNENY